jgi:hypothetical protein
VSDTRREQTSNDATSRAVSPLDGTVEMLRPECPGEELLLAFVAHRLDQLRAKRVEYHLASCSMCRRLVSDLVREISAPVPTKGSR